MAPPKASSSEKGQRVVIRTLGRIKGSLKDMSCIGSGLACLLRDIMSITERHTRFRDRACSCMRFKACDRILLQPPGILDISKARKLVASRLSRWSSRQSSSTGSVDQGQAATLQFGNYTVDNQAFRASHVYRLFQTLIFHRHSLCQRYEHIYSRHPFSGILRSPWFRAKFGQCRSEENKQR